MRAITFQPELPGFIVRIERARGDYANLCLAYSIAREMALMGVKKVHGEHLNLVLKRMVRDLNVLGEMGTHLESIEKSAKATMAGVEAIRQAVSATQESLTQTNEVLRAVLAGESSGLDRLRLYFNERSGK